MKPDGVGKPTTTTQTTQGQGKKLGHVNKGHKGWESDINPAGKQKGEGFRTHNKHFLEFKQQQAAAVPTDPTAPAPTTDPGLDITG